MSRREENPRAARAWEAAIAAERALLIANGTPESQAAQIAVTNVSARLKARIAARIQSYATPEPTP